MLDDAAYHMQHLLVCFSIVPAPIRMVLLRLQHRINGYTRDKILQPLLQFIGWCCKLGAPFLGARDTVAPFVQCYGLCSTTILGLMKIFRVDIQCPWPFSCLCLCSCPCLFSCLCSCTVHIHICIPIWKIHIFCHMQY